MSNGKLSPFDFLNSINTSKVNLMKDDPIAVKQYNSFMVNRGLSYFPDTILAANEMNFHHTFFNDAQYSFLLNITTKRKRFSKWHKSKLEKNVDIIKEYYGYNNVRATEALSLLTDEQIDVIKKKLYKGGKK